jgi:hypothetical protein
VRTGGTMMSKSIAAASCLSLLLIALGGASVMAQEYETEIALEGFPDGESFSTRYVGDYAVVADGDYCRLLIGATFGPTARYLTEDLVGKKAKAQRQALIRFAEPDDQTTTYCAGVLEGMGSTILPESLAPLLVAAGLEEAAVPPGEGLTISGEGAWNSAPFSLDGGLYLAQVENTGCATWNGYLIDVADALGIHDPITESDLLEDVEPGDYYWTVLADDCEWAVTLLSE